jgi:uncharacterized small protein (DUF1192 family)
VSEYTHNDEVAEIIYSKDREIQELAEIATQLERRITDLQAEVKRLETEYARGL